MFQKSFNNITIASFMLNVGLIALSLTLFMNASGESELGNRMMFEEILKHQKGLTLGRALGSGDNSRGVDAAETQRLFKSALASALKEELSGYKAALRIAGNQDSGVLKYTQEQERDPKKEKVQREAFASVDGVITAAVDSGQWTMYNAQEIRKSIHRMEPKQRLKLRRKISKAISNGSLRVSNPKALIF